MSDKSADPSKRMAEGLYWWGVPTLFRCPYIENPKGLDIGLVGVPHSAGNGTTERDQHLGPRAVRDVSALGRRVHLRFGLDPWESANIADLGDVPLPEGNDNERSIERITAFYRKIDRAGARPVSIGGDHSITGGIVQAMGGKAGHLCGGKPVSLFHLDAHTDVFTSLDHFLGARKSAAHWGAYLADQGHVDPSSSVQIGLRGNPRTLEWLQPSYDYGYKVVSMADHRQHGMQASIDLIKATLGDRPIYMTFDLDCLDTTVAPGVSNPEMGEGGFSIDEAMTLLRAVRGMNIIGADVVCLMPTKDSPNKQTALVATQVMFEMISLIADRQQS